MQYSTVPLYCQHTFIIIVQTQKESMEKQAHIYKTKQQIHQVNTKFCHILLHLYRSIESTVTELHMSTLGTAELCFGV